MSKSRKAWIHRHVQAERRATVLAGRDAGRFAYPINEDGDFYCHCGAWGETEDQVRATCTCRDEATV